MLNDNTESPHTYLRAQRLERNIESFDGPECRAAADKDPEVVGLHKTALPKNCRENNIGNKMIFLSSSTPSRPHSIPKLFFATKFQIAFQAVDKKKIQYIDI